MQDIDLSEPLMDLKAIEHLTGGSRMTNWRLRQDPEFPPAIMLNGRPKFVPAMIREFLKKRMNTDT